MTKHTPGPWFAIPHPEWKGAKVRIDTKKNTNWENFGEICYARRNNANLIAAAPDLLAALEHVYNLLPVSSITDDDDKMVRRAIAKARGES